MVLFLSDLRSSLQETTIPPKFQWTTGDPVFQTGTPCPRRHSAHPNQNQKLTQALGHRVASVPTPVPRSRKGPVRRLTFSCTMTRLDRMGGLGGRRQDACPQGPSQASACNLQSAPWVQPLPFQCNSESNHRRILQDEQKFPLEKLHLADAKVVHSGITEAEFQ